MSVNSHERLEAIYERRFSPEVKFRQQMWQVLCTDFFQAYVPQNSYILELAAGYCEFINHIKAARKTAVDLNPTAQECANPDVKVVLSSAANLVAIDSLSQDIVFTSNFLEHLSRADILQTLAEAYRVLKPGGKILILQPNIRFCAKDYWMFFDHLTPLDHHSVAEALEISGFRVEKTIVRFLPFTTKNALPKHILLVKLYLKIPLVWRIFGQQSFIVASKP